MRKVIMTVALIGTIGLATTQIAAAHGGFTRGGGYGNCNGYGATTQAYSEEDAQAYETFLDETADIRKEIVVKRSELNALYRQDNADPKAVGTLTGELYDLQNQLSDQAPTTTAGGRYDGHGPAMMEGNGGWHRGWWGMMGR